MPLLREAILALGDVSSVTALQHVQDLQSMEK